MFDVQRHGIRWLLLDLARGVLQDQQLVEDGDLLDELGAQLLIRQDRQRAIRSFLLAQRVGEQLSRQLVEWVLVVDSIGTVRGVAGAALLGLGPVYIFGDVDGRDALRVGEGLDLDRRGLGWLGLRSAML